MRKIKIKTKEFFFSDAVMGKQLSSKVHCIDDLCTEKLEKSCPRRFAVE